MVIDHMRLRHLTRGYHRRFDAMLVVSVLPSQLCSGPSGMLTSANETAPLCVSPHMSQLIRPCRARISSETVASCLTMTWCQNVFMQGKALVQYWHLIGPAVAAPFVIVVSLADLNIRRFG